MSTRGHAIAKLTKIIKAEKMAMEDPVNAQWGVASPFFL